MKLLSEVMGSIQETLENFDLRAFGHAIAKDKKNTSTELVLVLPAESGLVLKKTLFSENAILKAEESTKRAIAMILNEVRGIFAGEFVKKRELHPLLFCRWWKYHALIGCG